MNDRIRQVLADHAHMDADPTAIALDADLYAGGMTSHASVQVMLALEDVFDVEFPDEYMTRGVFASIANISAALVQIDPAVVTA